MGENNAVQPVNEVLISMAASMNSRVYIDRLFELVSELDIASKLPVGQPFTRSVIELRFGTRKTGIEWTTRIDRDD